MRKFIILILGCLAFQLAICQNSFIYSFHRTDGLKSDIVYSEQNNAIVVYEETDAGCYFIVYKNDEVKKAECPSNVRVLDMDCIDDYVYYCGKSSSENKGVIGRFNILDILNNTIGHYILYDQCTIPYTSYNYDSRNMHEVFKLECFKNEGIIHIAFLSRFNTVETQSNTTIGEAYSDGYNWYLTFDYNKGFSKAYYDLAITNDFIVAVGTTENTIGYATFGWKKCPTFLTAQISPHILKVNQSGILVNRAKIVKINNNDFVVSYANIESTPYISDDYFKIPMAIMTPISRYIMSSDSMVNPLLLIDVASIGADSIVHLYNTNVRNYFSINRLGMSSWVQKEILFPIDKVNSICKYSGGSLVFSGITIDPTVAFGYECQYPTIPNCFNPTFLDINIKPLESTRDGNYPYIITLSTKNGQESKMILYEDLIPECLY